MKVVVKVKAGGTDSGIGWVASFKRASLKR